MSDVSYIQYNYIGDTVSTNETRNVNVNEALMLTCNAPPSAPVATRQWYTITSTGDVNPVIYATESQTSTSIQIHSVTGTCIYMVTLKITLYLY